LLNLGDGLRERRRRQHYGEDEDIFLHLKSSSKTEHCSGMSN
jgi:hypothetical protein